VITTRDGTQILTNPYVNMLAYLQPETEVRIVTSSRASRIPDDASGECPGFNYIRAPGLYSVNGILIRGVETLGNDFAEDGEEKNIIYNMRIDGLSVCHVGELENPLSETQIAAIGKVDILFLPIGGGFTLDPRGAAEVMRQLQPSVVTPMHYITRSAEPGLMTAKVGAFVSASARPAHTYDTFEAYPSTIKNRTEVAVLKHYWS
jgi:hypothetical protein